MPRVDRVPSFLSESSLWNCEDCFHVKELFTEVPVRMFQNAAVLKKRVDVSWMSSLVKEIKACSRIMTVCQHVPGYQENQAAFIPLRNTLDA